MHPSVHGSSIYNSQDMEAMQVSIRQMMDSLMSIRGMDENVVLMYNGILFSHKKRVKFCHQQQHRWTWEALCLVK